MKKVGILFLYLLLGLVVIIIGVSVAFSLNPLEFFNEIKASRTISITYIVLLYCMVFFVLHKLVKKDDPRGLKSLGLAVKEANFKKILIIAIFSFGFFGFYIITLIASGGAILSSSIATLVMVFLEGLFFGFLFALVEEVMFRGYILQSLLKEYSKPAAFIFANSIFAILHIFRPGDISFKIIYFTGIFLLGILLSFAYYKTKNLWLPVIIHSVLIGFTYIYSHVLKIIDLYYKPYNYLWGIQNSPVAGLMALFYFICIFLVIRRIFKNDIPVHDKTDM